MQRHRAHFFVLVMGIPLLLVLLTACGAGTATTSTPQGTITIKIGSDFPVSGDDTTAGLPAQNGIQFAVDEANHINFLPGYTFVLDHRDDVGAGNKHDPTKGQQNIAALVGDAQVAGIVGPLNSNVAYTELPTANEAPIALISPSNSSDCLTQETPASECGGANSKLNAVRPTHKVTYFRTSTMDQYQGLALALFAKDKGYKRVFIIDDTEAYGAGLANNFELSWKKLGLSVIDHRSIAVTNSYENLLTTAAATHPDLIFFGGNDSTGGIPIRQQMKDVAGLEHTPFMVGDGTKTANFASNIAPLGGGPVYASVLGLDPSQVAKAPAFVAAYDKKYGATNFGAYTPGGYDDAWIILHAIKTAIQVNKAVAPRNSNDAATAKAFRQAVIDAIQHIQYDGVTGHHSFDANGDTTNKAISIYTLGTVGAGDGWKFVARQDAVMPNA